MDIERFSRRMIELMPQMIRGFARHEHNSLSRGEITMPQLWLLEHLARQPQSRPMHELARFLSVSKPAATGLIDRLISQQLVRREPDARDRRIVRIAITAKGRRVLANIWDQKRRMIVEVFGQISPPQRAQYLSILEQVAATVSREPSAPGRR